jgi:hypothetical protein
MGMGSQELRLVDWVDAAHRDGWHDPDDLGDFGISVCRTVGYVLRDNEEEVWLAQSVDIRHGNVDAVMAIPRRAIDREQTLKSAEGEVLKSSEKRDTPS